MNKRQRKKLQKARVDTDRLAAGLALMAKHSRLVVESFARVHEAMIAVGVAAVPVFRNAVAQMNSVRFPRWKP